VTGDQPGEGFVAPAEDVVRAFWHGAMVAAAPVGRMTPTRCALVAGAVVSASGAQTTGMDEQQARRSRALLLTEGSSVGFSTRSTARC
jgi:hypothetical protein